MNNKIYPCLWFNGEAAEAAEYYCSIFKDAFVLQNHGLVCTFSIQGAKIMALNGGPQYIKNESISFFVYCGNENEINRIYNELIKNGTVKMPLGKYDWSSRYAWVVDKFGVNWQLDIDEIRSDQKIVPNLLFSGNKMSMVKEAIHLYADIFPASKILLEAPHSGGPGLPPDSLIFAQAKLNGYILNIMSSPYPESSDFNPAISIVIECEDQNEIDHFWEKLGERGHYSMCGWLQDRYGVSWQIVPSKLAGWMSDPEKAPLVSQEFMKMQKFNIEKLESLFL